MPPNEQKTSVGYDKKNMIPRETDAVARESETDQEVSMYCAV
jgi:hypothetical protein